MASKKYREARPYEERYDSFKKIKKLHPDKIPIICLSSLNNCFEGYENACYKLLVPREKIFMEFIYLLRKKIKLKSYQALIVLVNGTHLPMASMTIAEVYEQYVENEGILNDGFLYLEFCNENVFGE